MADTNLRWSERINRLLQTGQMKFFSPVWVRMCRASSSDRANFLLQPSQVHGNGLSPENIYVTRAGKIKIAGLSFCAQMGTEDQVAIGVNENTRFNEHSMYPNLKF